jgi:hypothetical protein
MTDELKPCPFCHKEQPKIDDLDYYGIIRGDKDEDDGWSAQYECPYCYAMGPYVKGFSEEDSAIDVAITAWNARHDSDELPEWVVNKLNDSIVDCGLLEAELKDDNDIEEAVRVGRRANTLRWVLSLRKPEETE